MTNLKTLIILALTIVLPSMMAKGQTACIQKFEIQNVKNDDSKSSFDLKIQSKDIYAGQLVELVNANEQTNELVVQSFSGQNDQKHTFKNLPNSLYRVILEFKNEAKFLCKRRIVTIDLTDSSKKW